MSGTRVSAEQPLYRRILTRLFDLTAGLTLAILTLPALLVLATGSWIAFGWAPLLRTSFIGKDDRRFNLFLINSTPEWGTDLRGRRRRFSGWLRSTGLDKLPALWNVVLGHLSLVGPPPVHPSIAAELDEPNRESVRPGLTGSWSHEL